MTVTDWFPGVGCVGGKQVWDTARWEADPRAVGTQWGGIRGMRWADFCSVPEVGHKGGWIAKQQL